jgi:hypothetical protein
LDRAGQEAFATSAAARDASLKKLDIATLTSRASS